VEELDESRGRRVSQAYRSPSTAKPHQPRLPSQQPHTASLYHSPATTTRVAGDPRRAWRSTQISAPRASGFKVRRFKDATSLQTTFPRQEPFPVSRLMQGVVRGQPEQAVRKLVPRRLSRKKPPPVNQQLRILATALHAQASFAAMASD
jgi:hypothetical protein